MTDNGGVQEPLFALGPGDSFVAARNKLEAVTRLSALTHSPPEELGPGSKERKSVLTNLARGLGLEVNLGSTKPALGRAIAHALRVVWTAECDSTGDTITLIGLNLLLEAGEAEVRRRTTQQSQRVAQRFIPARSKLEAVSRMSALTSSPPESLGPGSKERKSAMSNLAAGLGLQVRPSASKVELGAEITRSLRMPWSADCWSTGNTITLIGLNRMLEGAERRLRARTIGRRSLFDTALAEATAILEVLATSLPTRMDGRECVLEMLAAEDRNWAQDEWAGFYFEFRGLPSCVNTFAGGPVKFLNTRFDYGLGQVWDLKLHAAKAGVAPLNAIDATRECLRQGRGLGFLVLSGDVEYDDGEFRQWQRELRIARGKKRRSPVQVARAVRKSKRAFTPRLLEAFFLSGEGILESAIENRSMRLMTQGRQASGAPRLPKFQLDFARARSSGLMIASRELSSSHMLTP